MRYGTQWEGWGYYINWAAVELNKSIGNVKNTEVHIGVCAKCIKIDLSADELKPIQNARQNTGDIIIGGTDGMQHMPWRSGIS